LGDGHTNWPSILMPKVTLDIASRPVTAEPVAEHHQAGNRLLGLGDRGRGVAGDERRILPGRRGQSVRGDVRRAVFRPSVKDLSIR
jgi:hypothetical protein